MKGFPLNGRVGQVRYGKGKMCVAYCRPLARYQLDTKKWCRNVEKDEAGRAFSIVNFNKYVGKRSEKDSSNFISFVMLDGTRVENYSTTGKRPGVSGWGISGFLSELDNMNDKVRASAVLVDNDGPLEEQSMLLAKYIDKLKANEKCKKVLVFGQSKCGCMAISMLKYLKGENLDKLDLQIFEAPFLGTIFATPLKLYDRLDTLYSSLSNKFLGSILEGSQTLVLPLAQRKLKDENGNSDDNFLLKKIKDLYWETLSRSHMDFDIALLGTDGIPQGFEDRYDSKFLSEMFNEKTLERLRKIKVTNITTKCTNNTLKESLKNLNGYGAMLYISSKVLFDEDADGMVPLKSSSYIEKVCKEKGILLKTRRINDGHHYPTGDTKLIHAILEPLLKEKAKEKELR